MREVMFGLSIPPSVRPGTDPVDLARMAEDLGFDFVSASDHPCGTELQVTGRLADDWTPSYGTARSTSTRPCASARPRPHAKRP
jgi:alkanesulfonate monooxygenase SsuD/methylene tetrahydromethanopterin reductase-like flavin-dependent oxidoreductase (luciferase family)